MDPSCKNIETFDENHAEALLNTFFSPHIPYSVYKELTINMKRALYNVFKAGEITGKTMIDLRAGPIIAHLLTIKDFVQETTLLVVNDGTLKALKKWKNKDKGCFDWSHAAEFLKLLKGKSHEMQDEEESLRGKIVKIIKWELGEDPVDLPKVDIVTSVWGLEKISRDHEAYRRNLRSFTNFVKPGGYFLLYAIINGSFYKVGKDKFHFLPCDERFYRKVINEEGFEIKHCEKFKREMISDATDHEEMVFFIACKV
ncbi:hypothetical protein PRIEUP_LOCUS1689, partial [Pristimantis euphronides]